MAIYVSRTEEGTIRYPRHSHKHFEIMHYLWGCGNMWTEDGNIPFSEGTVIIMPPGLPHGSVSEAGFVNISIGGDFSGMLLSSSPIVITGTESDEGVKLATLIWENRHNSEAYLAALCNAYVLYLLQKMRIESEAGAAVRAIMLEISEQALNPEINVTELLRRSGYAEDYIRMCFKREVGRTPISFLTELRIKHACHLIDIYRTSLPLTTIAEKCGYTDYIYFSKQFKEHTGISPRAYQRATEG